MLVQHVELRVRATVRVRVGAFSRVLQLASPASWGLPSTHSGLWMARRTLDERPERTEGQGERERQEKATERPRETTQLETQQGPSSGRAGAFWLSAEMDFTAGLQSPPTPTATMSPQTNTDTATLTCTSMRNPD